MYKNRQMIHLISCKDRHASSFEIKLWNTGNYVWSTRNNAVSKSTVRSLNKTIPSVERKVYWGLNCQDFVSRRGQSECIMTKKQGLLWHSTGAKIGYSHWLGLVASVGGSLLLGQIKEGFGKQKLSIKPLFT